TTVSGEPTTINATGIVRSWEGGLRRRPASQETCYQQWSCTNASGGVLRSVGSNAFDLPYGAKGRTSRSACVTVSSFAVGHDYADPHHHWTSSAVARLRAVAS